MDEGLLLAALVVEVALVALALVVLIGNAWRVAGVRRHRGPRLVAVSATLVAAVEGDDPDEAALDEISGLPAGAQIAVFAGVGRSLAGVQRERLAQVAAQVGLLARGEAWCGARRWGPRLRGARLLTLLGTGEGVMPRLLDDRRPEVRAQAAQWVGDHPDAASIERLLTMLRDPETLCRFTVKDALLRVGRPATEPLLRYLSEHDGAPAADALELAAGLADARFLAPALTLCKAADTTLRAGAAALLGAIGGSQATDALTELLGDAEPEVRSGAARGLGKLAHWPAAGRLAECLHDTSWDVRRTVAIALRAFGAPGLLMLRRALNDDDRFAQEMARQVLELPANGELQAIGWTERAPERPTSTNGDGPLQGPPAKPARPSSHPDPQLRDVELVLA